MVWISISVFKEKNHTQFICHCLISAISSPPAALVFIIPMASQFVVLIYRFQMCLHGTMSVRGIAPAFTIINIMVWTILKCTSHKRHGVSIPGVPHKRNHTRTTMHKSQSLCKVSLIISTIWWNCFAYNKYTEALKLLTDNIFRSFSLFSPALLLY